MAAFGQEFLVGVDIGSTSVKVCLYSTDQTLVAKAWVPTKRAYRSWTTIPGRKLMDPQLLWNLVSECCEEVLSPLPDKTRRSIKGLAVAGVGGHVYLDKHNVPVVPIGGTTKGRSDLYDSYLTREKEYFETTGYPLNYTNVPFYLAWLRENDVQTFAAIDSIMSVSDYINLRFTGERGRDYSTACTTGLWDYTLESWWSKLLNDLELSPAVLGKPRYSGAKIGNVTQNVAQTTGLPVGLPVFLGGHDYLCAALAVGCISSKSILDIVGTYEILASFHRDRPLGEEFSSLPGLTHRHVVPNCYSYALEAIGCGHTEWIRDLLFHTRQKNQQGLFDWNSFYGAIPSLAPSFAETFEVYVPQTFGRYYPTHSGAALGCFYGLNRNTNDATLVRATLEGICFQARQMLEGMHQILRSQTQPIVVVGGGTLSGEWMQIKSNVFGLPLIIPTIQEATALGAALLAGIGLGIYSNPTEASELALKQGGVRVVAPDLDMTRLYDDIYHQVYLPLCKTLDQIDANLATVTRKRSGEGLGEYR